MNVQELFIAEQIWTVTTKRINLPALPLSFVWPRQKLHKERHST